MGCGNDGSQSVKRWSSQQNVVRDAGVNGKVSDFNRPISVGTFPEFCVKINVSSGIYLLTRESHYFFCHWNDDFFCYAELLKYLPVENIDGTSLINQCFHYCKVRNLHRNDHKVSGSIPLKLLSVKVIRGKLRSTELADCMVLKCLFLAEYETPPPANLPEMVFITPRRGEACLCWSGVCLVFSLGSLRPSPC